MPLFKPFRGIKPHTDLVETFTTKSTESFTEEQIKKEANVKNSYINMLKPFLCSKSKDIDRNMRKVRSNFETLLQENKITSDYDSSFYMYKQINPNNIVHRGLIGLTSVEDFINGKIKTHERILPHKMKKLEHYLSKVKLQAEPVLLTYNSNPKIEMLMDLEEKNIPVINFSDKNNVKHKLWKIDNRLKLQQYKEVIEQIETFYIADGHHRMASAMISSQKNTQKSKKHTGLEAYNFVISYIVSNQSIRIHDYNRLIKSLNGLSKEEFLNALEKFFIIAPKGITPYYPSQKYHLSMYLDGEFYGLYIKHNLRNKTGGLEDSDHYFLERNVAKGILDIKDTTLSDEIGFLKGNSSIDGILEIKKLVDNEDYKVGFAIHPIPFSDLVNISNMNQEMPPKCTYIEPKLLSGLVMYDTKEKRG